MLRRIAVTNFRCFRNLEISFEPDITLVAGENDCGKSSLLDVISMAFSGRSPDPSDFHNGEEAMRWELEFDTAGYVLEFRKEGDPSKWVTRTVEWGKLKRFLEDPFAVDNLSSEEIRGIFSEYGKTTQKRTLESLRQEFGEWVEVNRRSIEQDEKGYVEVRELQVPCKAYTLDGKKFEDISSFVREVYLTDALRQIWSEKIRDGDDQATLENIITELVERISNRKQEEINDAVLPVIREFLPEVCEIKL